MKKGRLYALMGFVVLVVGTALYTVNFLYEKEQTSQAIFDTKFPEIGNIILKTVASGSIQPRQEILIKPQVSGIVREVHIEAGDLVKAGDILAEVTIVPGFVNNYVVPLCEDLAKMGYVVASMSYRLGIDDFFNLATSLQEAAMRGVQDAKAAIRFFRKSHATEGNPWGIDPERIVLGGSSAGGFIALHAAYVDDLSEIPSSVDFNANGLSGGIEGESGSPGYSSEMLSIFSISGAIGDADWISAGNTPVVSTHGTDDGTVPFGTGYVQLSGINVLIVDGSETIHNKADLLGIDNCLHTFPGADHTPHQFSTQYYDTTRAVTVGFTSRQVCPLYPPICGWYDVDDPPPIINTCPTDIVSDGIITVADVLEVLGQFGCAGGCFADVDGDGAVTVSDVLAILAVFGETCPT